MAVVYYIKAAVSEYTDKENNPKKKYSTIGIVMETKHGLMMKIETIPLLQLKGGSIMAYLNTPEDEKKSQEPAPEAAPAVPDDLPF
jgi:hypothetical protein